jgi:methyl-accepting chemotaxis protein
MIKKTLQKKVDDLANKSRDNDYILRGKLLEKDEEMKLMKQQLNTMQSQIQTLIATIGNTKDQTQVNNVAKTLYDSGILNVPESKSQNSLGL